MEKSVTMLAARIDRSLALAYQDYLDACDQDRAEGHRPHYCEHGMTQWVDYDNICGPCEDGRTMGDPIQRMEFAIDEAKRKNKACQELAEAANKLYKLMPDFDYKPVWKRITEILECDYRR